MTEVAKNAEPEANIQLQLSLTAAPRAAPAEPKEKPKEKAPWLTPVTAPILVAMLALIVPATTAVNAHIQANLQLELDHQKQSDERTRLYLERAISADAGAESRVQVLRFLQIQSNDLALQQWAIAELDGLSKEVDTLKEKEETLVTEVAQTHQTVANLGLEQDEIVARLATVEPPVEQAKLRARLDTVSRTLERERMNEAEKSARLSHVTSRLRGNEVRYVERQVAVPIVAPSPTNQTVVRPGAGSRAQ
jgi:hypothetical protein